MTTPVKPEEKKPVIFKKPSPFNADPHNNRHGKSGGGKVVDSGGRSKIKSISVPKFKGGSGGDR